MLECPVCGADELKVPPYATWPPPSGVMLVPPYEDLLGLPSYEVCPNCGFEFGNDDNPGTDPPVSFRQYLIDWRNAGSPRFSASWEPALLVSDSGLWLGRQSGRWVVGRRSSRHPTDVGAEAISLLVLLERDWDVARLEIEELERETPALGAIPVRPTVKLALTAEVSPHWTVKSVGWLKAGCPLDGLHDDLARVSRDKRIPQRARHDAVKLLKARPA